MPTDNTSQGDINKQISDSADTKAIKFYIPREHGGTFMQLPGRNAHCVARPFTLFNIS